MTALPGRRRRSTIIASAAAVGSLVVAGALVALGAVTLYNSTEGADAASGVPELVFPATPTAAIAAVDDAGALASLAVLVVQPSGTGGSVVTVPVSADASNGKGDQRLPFAETFALGGPEEMRLELEAGLGLGLDAMEVVDAATLATILEAVGPIDVELPDDVTGADGEVVAEAGTTSLDATAAAAVLTARDPSVPALSQYPAATAVWTGIAAAIGEGITGSSGAAAPSAAFTDVVTRLTGGVVGTRGLRAEPADREQNPRGVDVSVLDQAEVTLVFAQIAPGRVAAPNPALTLRVEARYADDQLEGTGLTRDEIAYQAVSSLLFVGGNVLSVNAEPGEAPAATVVEIADESLADATDGVELLFGDIEVGVAASRIVGVDAVVRLGTEYLALLREESTDG